MGANDLKEHLEVKKVVRLDGTGSVKALCDLAVGDLFLIKGMRIVESRNGLFVSMPRQQGKNGKWYDIVTPLSRDVKSTVEETLLSAYERPSAEA